METAHIVTGRVTRGMNSDERADAPTQPMVTFCGYPTSTIHYITHIWPRLGILVTKPRSFLTNSIYNTTPLNTNISTSSTQSQIRLQVSRFNTMPAADPSQIKNTNAAAKDAGHANFPAFLLSYGLRIYNHEDVEEGKAILRGMGYGV
jgi:hypothetical protein